MKSFDSELEPLRERVDAIDNQLLALLNARAAVVTDIYAVKQRQGAPRFNRARTEAILERLTKTNCGPLTGREVHELFAPMLEFFVERFRSGGEDEGESSDDATATPR